MSLKQEFLKGFDNPENIKVIVEVTVPDCPETELIINHKPNFEGKKKYYNKAYNDNLELVAFPAIRITGYVFESESDYNSDGAVVRRART